MIEYRSWAQTASLLLFMWVIAYVIYRINPSLDAIEFNFLFWIFMLIISVSIVLRTENHHGQEEHLLQYTLLSPLTVFVSRLIFNICYLSIVGCSFYGSLLLFYYPKVTFQGTFLGLIFLGAIGMGAALSFIAAIARHGAGQNTVLSILSIPVLIPVILILHNMGISDLMMGTIDNAKYLTLLSISLLSIALSLMLFPYVWRE